MAWSREDAVDATACSLEGRVDGVRVGNGRRGADLGRVVGFVKRRLGDLPPEYQYQWSRFPCQFGRALLEFICRPRCERWFTLYPYQLVARVNRSFLRTRVLHLEHQDGALPIHFRFQS